MNILCMGSVVEVKDYVSNILQFVGHKPGIAIGSGNQIAAYVIPESFLAMAQVVRNFRGE